jgi:hypothetical protein
MRFFVGASSIEQTLQAREWITEPSYQTAFVDLERWVLNKEHEWGECYIFVEIPLPQGTEFGGRHNQFDMLVCFSDRLAICELKNNSSLAGLNLRRYVPQINGQVKWVKTVLKVDFCSELCLGRVGNRRIRA